MFKPYERVLVRDSKNDYWKADMFSHLDDDTDLASCIGSSWKYCIPYEGNEDLLGTTNSPPESEPEFKWGEHIEVLYNNEWCRAIYLWQSAYRGHMVLLNNKTPLIPCSFSICRHSNW